MKKHIAFFAVLAIFASFAAAPAAAQGKGKCPEVGHGVIQFVDVSGGCWRFLRDDGASFELVTGRKFKDGAAGTLYGRALDVFTICMVGQPTEVCRFAYDKGSEPTVIEGTLVKGVESGCWLIATPSDEYLILNCSDYEDLCLASNEGRGIRAEIAEKGNVITICIQGEPVDVLSFEWTDEPVTMSFDGTGKITLVRDIVLGSEDVEASGSQQGEIEGITVVNSSSASAGCESACLIACTLECRTLLGPAGEHTPEFMECFSPCLLRVQACQKICEEHAEATYGMAFPFGDQPAAPEN
jgi:hypothetical protein